MTPTPGSVVFVRRGLFREANRPGCAERDRWRFTVPCVVEFAEEGLTFQAVIFICRRQWVRPIYARRGDRRGLQARLLRQSVGGETRSPERDENSTRPFADIGNHCGRISECSAARHSNRGFPACAVAVQRAENLGGVPGCWNDDTSAMSHGKGLLTVLREMVYSRGLCVMGESEAAVSLTSCLRLVGLMHELDDSGAQVVCPTHSSIFAATPGADIIEVGEHGFRRVKWDERDRFDHWRRYLANPDRSLRHIVV